MTTKELINQYVTAHADNRWMDASELETLLTEFAEKLQEPASEDLSDLIDKLSKRYPEVSFAKLSRIAVSAAKWQREQMMKDAVDGEVNIWGSHISLPKVLLSEFSKQRVKVIIIKE